MATIKATPKKLRSGEWGAVAQTPAARKGDTVEITTKSGKSWTATISKVIWSGNGVSIVATQSSSPAPRRSRSYLDAHCDCSECRRGSESTCLRDWG